jgi:hypothetical protein
MPVALWDLLVPNPAYSFVGYTTSENKVVEPTNSENAAAQEQVYTNTPLSKPAGQGENSRLSIDSEISVSTGAPPDTPDVESEDSTDHAISSESHSRRQFHTLSSESDDNLESTNLATEPSAIFTPTITPEPELSHPDSSHSSREMEFLYHGRISRGESSSSGRRKRHGSLRANDGGDLMGQVIQSGISGPVGFGTTSGSNDAFYYTWTCVRPYSHV